MAFCPAKGHVSQRNGTQTLHKKRADLHNILELKNLRLHTENRRYLRPNVFYSETAHPQSVMPNQYESKTTIPATI